MTEGRRLVAVILDVLPTFISPSIQRGRWPTTKAQSSINVENIDDAHDQAVQAGVRVLRAPRTEPRGLSARGPAVNRLGSRRAPHPALSTAG
jgi:hypothetical protein